LTTPDIDETFFETVEPSGKAYNYK
jgi:hypothetical protein